MHPITLIIMAAFPRLLARFSPLELEAEEGVLDLPAPWPKISDRIQIANECEDKLKEVYEIAYTNPEVNHLFGIFYYEHPNPDYDDIKLIEKALLYFKKAFEIDTNKYMSCLYIGYCYQDLKQWKDAYEYYSLIDKEKFKENNPEWTWRIWKLEEQLIYCTAMMGEFEECKTRLNKFITNVEALNEDEFEDFIVNFDYLVDIIEDIGEKLINNRLYLLIVSKGYEFRYSKMLDHKNKLISKKVEK